MPNGEDSVSCRVQTSVCPPPVVGCSAWKGQVPWASVQITASPPVSSAPPDLVWTDHNRADNPLGTTLRDPAENVGRGQHPDAPPFLVHDRRLSGLGPMQEANGTPHQHLPWDHDHIAAHHVGGRQLAQSLGIGRHRTPPSGGSQRTGLKCQKQFEGQPTAFGSSSGNIANGHIGFGLIPRAAKRNG